MEDLRKNEVGVIIGRFQLPALHEGHISVLDYVTEHHSNVVVFLGVPRIQNTKRNPLDFSTRRKLIQERTARLRRLRYEREKNKQKE